LEHEHWTLRDVEVAHAERPDSFFIASLAERSALAPGRRVQLHFLLVPEPAEGPGAERMWVEILERRAEDVGVRYRGRLTSRPLHIRDLAPDAIVEFEPRHIGRILVRRGDPGWFEEMELEVLVSKRALASGARMRWAYREKPVNDRDSGWCMMEGSEADEEINNAANVRPVNAAWLNDRFPDLAEIWGNAAGCAFEWTAESGWRRVEGWSPG